ncbi:hypothetical protein C8R44DRAFT_862594 [Mycena epipterygia]|nr:hypothetical protein C8R44DRAFT_862594 [Mycena epipterygia]
MPGPVPPLLCGSGFGDRGAVKKKRVVRRWTEWRQGRAGSDAESWDRTLPREITKGAPEVEDSKGIRKLEIMAVVNPSASQILQHVVNREPAQRLIGRHMLPRSAPKVVAQAPSKSIPSAVRAHAGVQNLDSLGISTK